MPTQQLTRPTPLRWFTFFHWLTAIASLVALAVFVIDYGFYLASSQRFTIQTSYGVLAGIFLAVSIVQLIFWREHARTYLKKNAFAYIMSLLMLLGFLGILLGRSLHYGAFANAYSLLLKFYLLTNLWHKFILLSQSIAQYNTSPARFIVISFSSAILIGTALLLTPKATIEILGFSGLVGAGRTELMRTGVGRQHAEHRPSGTAWFDPAGRVFHHDQH